MDDVASSIVAARNCSVRSKFQIRFKAISIVRLSMKLIMRNTANDYFDSLNISLLAFIVDLRLINNFIVSSVCSVLIKY